MKKIVTAFGTFLAFGLIAAGLACQTSTNSNTANSNTTANRSGYDMSNMNGHDMSNMNGNGMSNMGGHDMANMSHATSAPGAADQPYDLQFIDSMMHHHDGAIAMARMALRKTERDELKKFAQKIIDDQNKENSRMKSWRDQWYAGKPNAMNMELPGMKMGSSMSADHEKSMEATQGKDFDIQFLNMMIPHHEGAVQMARELLQKGEHAELKNMANEIIREQEAEIKQMQQWKTEWSR